MKNNKQHGNWKRGNYGEKPKLYRTPKQKERMGEKQKLKKIKKKFQWTEEIVEYLLDSLKRYQVMCDFSRKDFDADKTVQYSKLWKEMRKNIEVLVQLKLRPTIYRF